MELCLNGKFVAASEPLITVDNRAFRYGDGCFETMQLFEGRLLLASLHFERLLSSLQLLHFQIPRNFTPSYLENLIIELATRNNVLEGARVRLFVWRSGGGLYNPEEDRPEFLIQTLPLNPSMHQIHEPGLVLGVCKDVTKSMDRISSVKAMNALPYVIAARFAKLQHYDDVLLLNPHGRIADSTICNLFIIKNNVLYTPPLSEGGVGGVMRKFILGLDMPFKVEEAALTIADVKSADEVFLSNSLFGLRWVSTFYECQYPFTQSSIIHELLFKELLDPRKKW
jgi:branched-chain amino acid aminotransferase